MRPSRRIRASRRVSRKAQLSCAVAAGQSRRLPAAGLHHRRPRRPAARALFHAVELRLEHQVGDTLSLRAQYVGTRAVNQPYQTQVNGYQTVCPGCFAPFPYGQPTDPRFGPVTQLSTGANSHYNGLQLTAAQAAGTRPPVPDQLHLEPLHGHGLQRRLPAVLRGRDSFAAARRSGPPVRSVRLRRPPESDRRSTSTSCRSSFAAACWPACSTDGRFRARHSGTAACRFQS